MSLKLLDGQGNFGSMDGDPPAAMRYTEIRLGKVASTLLDDIDKETVNFTENYDNSLKEPSVLPAKYPNLLVNGAGGIAVGMATNIPPHNLGEIIDATILLLKNPKAEDSEIKECILGPDFPTGGIIIGNNGIQSSYSTGRGSIIIRGDTVIETNAKEKSSIIINEIPYQVNKSRLVEQIADCVRSKKIEGITDLRDESDKDGVRIVVELKRDATPEVVLNQLHKFTSLQTSFGTNILALKNGMPTQFGIREILETFIEYRIDVIIKRTSYDLNKAREKEHILIGLAIAIENIDKIIEIIRSSKDSTEARENLIKNKWQSKNLVALLKKHKDERLLNKIDGQMYLSNEQAKEILELRLQRLTGLERNKVETDLLEISKKISELLEILSSDKLIRKIIIEELTDIKNNYAVDRRTKIFEDYKEKNIDDLIEKEDVVLTLTNSGYVKIVPVDFYRSQKRGGKGRSGMTTKEDDFVEKVLTVNSHDIVLFFTNKGTVHQIKVYKLPKGSPQSKGRPLINVIPLTENELTTAMLVLPNEDTEKTLIFVTKFGNVRRNKVSDFLNIKANGKRAMKLDNNDKLIQVLLVGKEKDIILSTSKGKCVNNAKYTLGNEYYCGIHKKEKATLIKKKKAEKESMVTLGKNMKGVFDEIMCDVSGIEIVLIENQISPIANRMKTIQGMIMQYFIMNGLERIEMISSQNKLKIYDDYVNEAKKQIGNGNSYNVRKKTGIMLTDHILSVNKHWEPYHNLFVGKKKDDLADSFLQGLYYVKKVMHLNIGD